MCDSTCCVSSELHHSPAPSPSAMSLCSVIKGPTESFQSEMFLFHLTGKFPHRQMYLDTSKHTAPTPGQGENSEILSLESFSPFPLKPHFNYSPLHLHNPGGSVNSAALSCGCSEVQGAGILHKQHLYYACLRGL